MKLKLIAPAQRGGGSVGGFAPPLSLGVLAALTPKDVEVTIIDENIEPINFDEKIDLVGITVLTATAPRAYEIAEKFRQKGVAVVLGGVHVTFVPEEASKHADAICLGEAEGYWAQVIEDFKQKQLKPVYRCEKWTEPLIVPIARRDLFKNKGYLIRNTLQVSRGCPFSCTFCSVTSFFGGTYRFRPVEDVLKEISTFKRKTRIGFVDDNIVVDPKRAKEFFKALIPYKIKWLSQGSISMANDDELLDLAAESGCIGMYIGFESISQKNLSEVIKSPNQVDLFEEAVRKIHSRGIVIQGSFIFGMDEDDETIFERTVRFAQSVKLELATFNIQTPLPGTPLYKSLEKEGRIMDRDWAHYGISHVVFKPKLMSPQVLLNGVTWAWKEFYSYPSIFRRIGFFRKNAPFLWMLNLAHRRIIPNLEKLAKEGVSWDV